MGNIKESPQHERRKEKIRIRRKWLKNRVQAFNAQIQESHFYVYIDTCMKIQFLISDLKTIKI